jgi:hypothetical protein
VTRVAGHMETPEGSHMERKLKIPRAMIEEARMKLANAVHEESDEVSKAQAIEELLPDVMDMQSRGFRLSQVAAILSETGIVVSTTSLTALMTKARARAHPKRAPRGKSTRTAVSGAPTRQVAAKPPAMPREKPETRAETPQQPRRGEIDKGAASSGKTPSLDPAAPTARGSREQVTTHYGFIPRKDTERI